MVRPGGIAAFGAPGADNDGMSGEVLVIFVESRRKRLDATQTDEILAAVRRSLLDEHEIGCHTIVLGTAGLVRKTTSGKIRRQACRNDYLSGAVQREDSMLYQWSADHADRHA